MEPDERHAGWVEDLDRLQGHVNELHIRAGVVESIDAELVRMQRPGSGFVTGVLRRMYAESQTVRVRLLTDSRKGTRSLVRLLGDMAQHSTVLTRERYVAAYKRHNLEWLGERDFDDLAGEGEQHIPRARLFQLQLELKEAGAVVKRYVDQRVAHEDRRGEATLKWGELKAAIDAVSRVYTKVGQILTAQHRVPEPAVQDEWRDAFREGLFRADDG